MAFTASEVGLSSVLAVYGREGRRGARRTTSALWTTEMGRRGLLLSVMLASSTATAPQVNDSRTELLQKYLKKSKENKAKNDKERLDDYYKRNYKDYFEFVEGSIQGKEELSEAEKGILDWLRANK